VIDIDHTSPGIERIVTAESKLDIVADSLLFGEGPLWHSRENALYWVDILGDTIWRWTSDRGQHVFKNPSGRANGMTFDLEHRLIVAGWSSRNIWRIEHDGSITVLADSYEGERLNSPNDIVGRSDGSIFWTDPSGALFIPGMEGDDVQRYLESHAVFCLSPDGVHLSMVTDKSAYPNGLAFSPDESIFYIADTWGRSILSHQVSPEGVLSPDHEILYELVGTEDGVADGLKVDVEGNLYVTGPAGVHVVSPDGRLLGRMLFPGEHCTNMAWGDSDWRTLFVTTFRRVYRLRLGIPGIPVGPVGSHTT
jgi:gluconolactonase